MTGWIRRMLGRQPRKQDAEVARLVALSESQTEQVSVAVRSANKVVRRIVDDHRAQDRFFRRME